MISNSIGNPAVSSAGPNRWLIALAAFCMQLALGSVYAWSVFSNPIKDLFHATKAEVSLTFSITLLALGITAGFGGYFQSKLGPRAIASIGGALYGLGVILAGFSPNLIVLYLTFGVLGGIGIGLGYIVPLAMLIKWFPDKRGLITGLAVAGFGLGAFLISQVAPGLIKGQGVLPTFSYLGIVYLVVVVLAAQFFRKAPQGYSPPGWQPTASQKDNRSTREFSFGEALKSPQWYVLWLILALNVTAGAALISVASPMVQDFSRVTAETAAIMVSVISIFNGVGRLFWGWISDRIGRPYTFLALFAVQAVLFLIMSQLSDFILLLIPGAIIGLCYGGGFGTMPAFAADLFGPTNSGTIYGAMLTAWSAGAIVGPLLITLVDYRTALIIIAVIMVASIALPFISKTFFRSPSNSPVIEGKKPLME